MYGIDSETWKVILDVLSKDGNIEEIILYGSRAKGTYKNGSDIDLCLKGHSISKEALYHMMDEIDDLYIPYKVDLSIYDKIENIELKDHIDRVGIKLRNL